MSFRAPLCLALGLAALAPVAQAADVVFASSPFTGSNADPSDGVRTIFTGNQRSLPSFDLANDRFVFDPAAFPVGDALYFANSLAANLEVSGLNVIVVQDTSPTFGAGTAANLIAATVQADGPGFFVYSNRVLGVNRLVYSTNLNLDTADLSVLARIESPSGPDALAAIPGFGAGNFALAAVPEPGSYALMLAGLGGIAGVARLRGKR